MVPSGPTQQQLPPFRQTMKPSHQSSKSYQADLYEQIKRGGNHVISLAHEGTKSFLLLTAIRNLSHELHPKYGSRISVIIEPDAISASERQRILNDHTELIVTNLFQGYNINLAIGQVVILSMQDVQSIPMERVNLVIIDSAHLLLLQNSQLVLEIVQHFKGVQQLTFMCSLIHNNKELTPNDTLKLIRKLELIFDAKCETSCDLRSLNRHSPATEMEVQEFNKPAIDFLFDEIEYMTDYLFKQYCDFICDAELDNENNSQQASQESDEPRLEIDLNYDPDSALPRDKHPIFSQSKQLVLVRSCIADVLYATHCLGLWCAKKTLQLYLTEFSRSLNSEKPTGDIIASAITALNILYTKFEFMTSHQDRADIVLDKASAQLKTLLEAIKSRPPVNHSNPHAPICIVLVRRRVIAKVIALWLDKIASIFVDYSFIVPNYIVGSARKHRNRMAVDNFDLHHEASVRDFKFGNCNVLVSSAVSERCTDIPRCSLVVSFDLPSRFSDFIRAKGNCRFDCSKYLVMINKLLEPEGGEMLDSFVEMERLLNNGSKAVVTEVEETELLEQLEPIYGSFPPQGSKLPLTIRKSVLVIFRYCSKLPSDSFTKLVPDWNIVETNQDGKTVYYCEIRLPINSPVRQTIVGPVAPTKNIASRLAAFTAAKILYESGELDENMMPITKETMRIKNPPKRFKELNRPAGKPNGVKGTSVGSTKRRQYYQKRIAEVFSKSLVREGVPCNLYKFKMVLNCPIPDEQNRRGRRIIDPSETNRNYGIVCTTALPPVCSFPLFTRSGEVFIYVELIRQNMVLTKEQVEHLRFFHHFTFSKVLKLEKYPIDYDSESPSTLLLAPVMDFISRVEIDWSFVDKIVERDRMSYVPTEEERRAFKFNEQNYIDAVVIPWYRLTDRQQFAYYVAEIRPDLTPSSPFPDAESGYETFKHYYKAKYDLDIYEPNQPILDVDHTSARLNLLTPRYVNRKGITLTSSTPKTRRESRENLIQKQLLIPELCTIHPFPASFWRKAVCLPCIFYRLNSLFLAEELRRHVAAETQIGFVEPPEGFEWPPLNFGWTLKDVVTNTDEAQEEDDSSSGSVTGSPTGRFGEQASSLGRFECHPVSIRELFVPNCPQVGGSTYIESLCKTLGIQSSESEDKMCSDMDTCEINSCTIIQNLDQAVEAALVSDPNMFKDDGIEPFAVDDSFADLEVHPNFGELLPNRDANIEWPDEEWKQIRFDPTQEEIQSVGPGPSLILQALTMSNASDGINLERLETVGDSFLKYSITAYLYCTYPTMHEGKLSFLRSLEISNANLYNLGKQRNLGEIMSATKFEPNDNWLPPGYTVANNKKREIDEALAEVPYYLLVQHSIPDKSIADCVEALIGAYLTSSGCRAALLFMRWLGLEVIPKQEIEGEWRWLDLPPSPLIVKAPDYDERSIVSSKMTIGELRQNAINELERHYHANSLDKFEKEIGYTFKDKAYLVQAFTHNSFHENHVTDCHQRLEFLGDAILDYLITRYLFEDPRGHSPGKLTDLRSALVNNTFFASLAVKYQFHKYLRYISDELSQVIDGFVKKFGRGCDSITKGYTLLISEGESEYAEDIEVPKALGDVFESVAGAIFLDSGLSLDEVWRVYFRIMKPEIEYFSLNVPKSPIRELLESKPQNVRFSPSELAPDHKHRVIAEVFGLGRFTGVGRSKHSAKSTAAKRALRMVLVKKRQHEEQQRLGHQQDQQEQLEDCIAMEE